MNGMNGKLINYIGVSLMMDGGSVCCGVLLHSFSVLLLFFRSPSRLHIFTCL